MERKQGGKKASKVSTGMNKAAKQPARWWMVGALPGQMHGRPLPGDFLDAGEVRSGGGLDGTYVTLHVCLALARSCACLTVTKPGASAT